MTSYGNYINELVEVFHIIGMQSASKYLCPNEYILGNLAEITQFLRTCFYNGKITVKRIQLDNGAECIVHYAESIFPVGGIYICFLPREKHPWIIF